MTEIKLYNTKTRKKEVFKPLDRKNVRMYVCGPTVYDRAHIGNARPVIVFDTLFRLLRHVYGPEHVTYARNFTDVDDKINARAAETGRSIKEITDETIQWYLDDMSALGALEPTLMPRATEYIPQMIELIMELITKGHAYAAEGHVLFDVNSYEHYGTLSGRTIKDMIAGARVEVAPYKRDPMDFVLWKPSSDDLPGWDSPWGRGRPGWHIECSAMSRALFGEKFDIHGGGLDLAFPHHENEKAQSCSICGEDCFAQVWMHNEMLQVEGKKMSKSLGNFFSVRDLLDQGYPGEVIRFVYLSTHYRKPMDWTEKKAKDAEATLDGWAGHFASYPSLEKYEPSADDVSPELVELLADDLNCHAAITLLHNLNKSIDGYSDAGVVSAKKLISNAELLLGINIRSYARRFLLSPRFMSGEERIELEDAWVKIQIKSLIEERNVARMNKDFNRSDEIRDIFAAVGVIIKDTPQGAEWELAPDFDASKLEKLL